jgi:type IV secretion system protein VirB10
MPADQPQLPAPDGVSAVAGPRLHFSGRQKIGILAVCGIVALLAIFVSHWLGGGSRQFEERTDNSAITAGLPFTQPAETKPAGKPLPWPMVAPTPSIQQVLPQVTTPVKDLAQDAGIFSYQGGGADNAANLRLANGARDGNGGVEDALSAALKHSDLGAPAKATLMKHPSLTVPAGTIIPCTLQTAINSELVGFVTCVTPAEVRSATGSVTLLDRGTQIMGEIRSGLRQGQDRLFILWVRARTPENVVISLDSPAADELGRAGVSGDVNNHWWRRFGNALLFSIIGAAPQLGATALQTRNGNIGNSYVQFFSPEQQMADTVLENEINIPPTLERNQGTTVSVMVARDLDFSSVYDLKQVRP